MSLFNRNKPNLSNVQKFEHAWLNTKDTFRRVGNNIRSIGSPGTGGGGAIRGGANWAADTATDIATGTVNVANRAVNNKVLGPIILFAGAVAAYKFCKQGLQNLFNRTATKKVKTETEVLETRADTAKIRAMNEERTQEMVNYMAEGKGENHWKQATDRMEPRQQQHNKRKPNESKVLEMSERSDGSYGYDRRA